MVCIFKLRKVWQLHHTLLTALLQNGWTPLHAATSKGHEQVVNLLLEAGASVEQETKVRWGVSQNWKQHEPSIISLPIFLVLVSVSNSCATYMHEIKQAFLQMIFVLGSENIQRPGAIAGIFTPFYPYFCVSVSVHLHSTICIFNKRHLHAS